MEIRELHRLEEFHEAFRLFDGIWRPDPRNPPVPVELMIAFAHGGGYVAGAYEGGRLVGASVGFLAAGGALHSHVTGALPGLGAGSALKLHQREWCRARGLERITWTFDPLVRRNARFNLVKLGARPEQYLECFYGVMADEVNEGDESDRLLAVWRLDRLTEGPAEVSYPSVLADAGGRPAIGPAEGRAVLVATPADVEALRREDPGAAREWRLATRATLGGLMASGARVTDFTRNGEYVVERD
ncbi:GNAT family N-acetyltransferase [Nonomuraea sp. NPDC049649]|uniref:GNAT family N-acetyltransferase n=1 Tax=Nonomuraea sp. NPDC049649 TaxID=3155776 RepID=UPI00341A2950